MKPVNAELSASNFIKKLERFRSDKELDKAEKYFKGDDAKIKSFGATFGDVFKLAKEFWNMPLNEIDELLKSDYYEIRVGAVSIMDFQAKNKKTSAERKKELFELYLNRHDRLNNWDFVDRGAPGIVGAYLIDKPKDILYKLAKSKDPWRRRTAIVSTFAFIRKGEIEDTFDIAAILIHDKHELVNKAVGSWIREAGKRNPKRLLTFLDQYAATMPRVTLRYALEKLSKKVKDHYMALGK
jgi:3-methyladenine DNA glycosylase AlkD